MHQRLSLLPHPHHHLFLWKRCQRMFQDRWHLEVKDSLLSDEDEAKAKDNWEGSHRKGHFHSIFGLHVTEHLFEIANIEKPRNPYLWLTFLKISSTSGMRSRRQAPMKTPPEKQEEKEITARHLFNRHKTKHLEVKSQWSMDNNGGV